MPIEEKERKAKRKEQARKNAGEKQGGEEQTKESSLSSSSVPESKPGIQPSLLKPRPVFPETMSITLLNDDWILPLEQVDLQARLQREVMLASEIAAWKRFQYEQEQQGQAQASKSATESKDAAHEGSMAYKKEHGGVDTRSV